MGNVIRWRYVLSRTDAVIAQAVEREQSSARPQDAANLPQARTRITPEIQGVDGKRPVKARGVERNRCAVSLAKVDSTLRDRATISANRQAQHRFGDVDAADATVVHDASEALDCAAVAETDFQDPIERVRDEAGEAHARSNPRFRAP